MNDNISSKELRNKRENFRQDNWHKYLPEVSLVAAKESTAMFNVAGMQQLVPYLAGKKHPTGDKLFNIQKCIRTNDIDEVWDASHLTFFEMMGNRSLWDYFKKEAVQYSYDFLINELWFDKNKLAVTVFEWNKDAPKDEETAQYRINAGISKDKISFMDAKNNRRTPGPIWPCGPDTEIFYRVGEWMPTAEDNVKKMEDDNAKNPNNKENWLEIRNNVFMEYYRDETWKLTKLKNQNVDTGMWFERMSAILQDKETIFETDLFQPILDIISKYTDLKYSDNTRRFRIISDHIRTAAILLNDGVIQSNVWSWYVLRMIIRRMYYNLMLLKDMSDSDFQKMLSEIVNFVADVRPIKIQEVTASLISEVNTFKKTISRGLKILDEKISKIWSKWELAWVDIFFLYDTCGFPLELTREICLEKNVKLDEKWFKSELETQKERSRKSAKFQKDIDRSKYLEWIPQTEFIWYLLSDTDTSNQQSKLLKDFDVNWQRVLIFDKTPFYAESGWQKGDSWNIQLDGWEILKIKDVQKYEWVFLHLVA